MDNLNTIDVEITVELGAATMPIHHLLRLGRGAVIELDATEHDTMRVYANSTLIARAEIRIDDGRVNVEITEKLRRAA
jgi:flagellar motor switch protein FliN/FliY